MNTISLVNDRHTYYSVRTRVNSIDLQRRFSHHEPGFRFGVHGSRCVYSPFKDSEEPTDAEHKTSGNFANSSNLHKDGTALTASPTDRLDDTLSLRHGYTVDWQATCRQLRDISSWRFGLSQRVYMLAQLAYSKRTERGPSGTDHFTDRQCCQRASLPDSSFAEG